MWSCKSQVRMLEELRKRAEDRRKKMEDRSGLVSWSLNCEELKKKEATRFLEPSSLVQEQKKKPAKVAH